MSVRCFKCQGPYHEATGHRFELVDVVYCGPCYRPFMQWSTRHMRARPRKGVELDFYGAAYTSIRAGGGNCPTCQGPTTGGRVCVQCERERDFQAQMDAAFAADAAAITTDEQIRKGYPE